MVILSAVSVSVLLVLGARVGLGTVTVEERTSVVSTKYGRVQGFVTRVGRDAAINKLVKVFLGVPYASPPTGNYRFAPTRPPTHWTGVFSATSLGPVCPQVLPGAGLPNSTLGRLVLQSEDCLNLNIYLPHSQKGREVTKYPVMVYIHGESYLWGSGNLYDGRVLAAYGRVVVVTINYRLGILGFLNTNTAPHQHPSMANYGLMDQIAALKWVQQNIEQFGGDHGAVTLFGYRTGAAAIHFLMESPAAVTGMFHRAILMSGSGVSPWSMVEDPVHYAVKLAAALNCSLPSNMLKNHLQIVECLRERSVAELLSVELTPPEFLVAVGPSRDGVLIPTDFGLNSFQIKKRSANPIYQVMVGVSEQEQVDLFSPSQLKLGISPHEKNRILRNLARNCYDYHVNEIFFSIETEYTDYTGDSPHRRLELAETAVADKLFVSPAVETVNWANESGYPAYLYIHKYKELESEGDTDFMSLVFGLMFAPEISSIPPSTTRSILSQTILTYWANFAHTGNPNSPSSIDDLFSSKTGLPPWRRFTVENQDYLELDLDPTSRMYYRPRTMATWLKLIPKLHLSGSDHSFPDHSTHTRNQYRGWGPGKEGQAQPNLAYDSVQLGGTCPNQTNTSATIPGGGSGENHSVLSLGGLGDGPPENTVLLVLSLGLLLVLGNVWFWVCFVVQRRTIICCMTNGAEMKNLTEEQDLSLAPPKPDYVYQRRVPGDVAWYESQDNLSKTDTFSQGSSTRFGPDDQSISLISTGHVPRTSHQVELYGKSSKTLPRDYRSAPGGVKEKFGRAELPRASSQTQITAELSSVREPPRMRQMFRSNLSPGLSRGDQVVVSIGRPRLTTFCSTEPQAQPAVAAVGRSSRAQSEMEVQAEQGGSSRTRIQGISTRIDGMDPILKPESV